VIVKRRGVKAVPSGKGTAFFERGNGDLGDHLTLRSASKIVNTHVSNFQLKGDEGTSDYTELKRPTEVVANQSPRTADKIS